METIQRCLSFFLGWFLKILIFILIFNFLIGLKISLKSKIRVNNLIWRAWHIKYVLGKLPAINPFPSHPATEQLEANHLYIAHRPEVVMKIGKYFKANNEFIGLEYNKWRRYYKENILFIQNQRNVSFF